MLNEHNIAQTYQRFKSRYQKRLSSKDKITIDLNESPVSSFKASRQLPSTKIGNTFLYKPNNTKAKRFDDILDNYFSVLPNKLEKDLYSSRVTNGKTPRSHSKSQRKLQDAMQEIKAEFNSSIFSKDRIETAYKSRRNTPSREYHGTPYSVGDEGVPKEELRKVLMHVERMSMKDFAELPASYRSNLNRLAQIVQVKQKVLEI